MESEDYFLASSMFFVMSLFILIVGLIAWFANPKVARHIVNVIGFLRQWVYMYPFLFTSIGFLLFGIEQKEKEEKKFQEEKNLRWVLIISLFMFYTQGFLLLTFGYQVSDIKKWLSVISLVFLTMTITSSTLFTAGYGKKELVYKISIYSFIISMAIFLASYLLVRLYPM